MKEEYCWAITQVVGDHAVADQVPVCFELSGFKLASLVHIEVDHMYTHFGLGKNSTCTGPQEIVALVWESACMSIFKPNLVHMYLLHIMTSWLIVVLCHILIFKVLS